MRSPPFVESLTSLYPDERWTILARPNSRWQPGDVIDVDDPATKKGDPRPIPAVQSCLPTGVWKQISPGHGAEFDTNAEYGYGLDVAETLKIGTQEQASVDFAPTTDANSVIVIRQGEGISVEPGTVSMWLIDSHYYEALPQPSRDYFLSSRYRIVGDAYIIIDGEIRAHSQAGGKDGGPLFTVKSLDVFKQLLDVNSAFNANAVQDGKIIINTTTGAVTIAIGEAALATEDIGHKSAESTSLEVGSDVSVAPLKSGLERYGATL